MSTDCNDCQFDSSWNQFCTITKTTFCTVGPPLLRLEVSESSVRWNCQCSTSLSGKSSVYQTPRRRDLFKSQGLKFSCLRVTFLHMLCFWLTHTSSELVVTKKLSGTWYKGLGASSVALAVTHCCPCRIFFYNSSQPAIFLLGKIHTTCLFTE